jgi:hypothetical protein
MSSKEIALLFIMLNYLCLVNSKSFWVKASFVFGLLAWEVKLFFAILPDALALGKTVAELIR